MRVIIQRVLKASVRVGDELVSSIGRGMCVLVGISRDDTQKDMEYLVRKLLNLRIFDDDQDRRWSKSVVDKNYEILCVSQFTLYSVLKGNKPDFHCSMGGDESKIFYDEFLTQMKKNYNSDFIKDGLFGANMLVSIENDGPVTISLESPPHKEPKIDRRCVKNAQTNGEAKFKELAQPEAQSEAQPEEPSTSRKTPDTEQGKLETDTVSQVTKHIQSL